jgi:hypothetical protein
VWCRIARNAAALISLQGSHRPKEILAKIYNRIKSAKRRVSLVGTGKIDFNNYSMQQSKNQSIE